MFLFTNLDDEVNVYDKRQGGFLSVTGEEPILCKYRKGDVLKVLLNEKPLLESYQFLNILHVSVENYIIIDSLPGSSSKLWRAHMSFSNGLILGGGSETIENLDQKIRDIKLINLGI
jgi:hypothetical protein